MAAPGDTVSAPFIGGLLAAANRCGVDARRILSAAGIAPEWLHDPEKRVPRLAFLAVWSSVAAQSGDPDIALTLAEHTELDRFAVLGYAVRSAATLGDAWRAIARWAPLLHDRIEVTLDVSGREATLCCRQPGDTPRAVAAWLIASWVVAGRALIGDDWAPLRVALQHPTPESPAEYRRLFRSPVVFEAPATQVVIAAELLARPARYADPRLSAVVGGYAENLLARARSAPGPASLAVGAPPGYGAAAAATGGAPAVTPGAATGDPRRATDDAANDATNAGAPDEVEVIDEVIDRARRVIAAELASGDPRLDTVAEKLAMSPRTLQRRIKRAGLTSYRDLLASVRRDLAEAYLRDPTVAIRDAAFLLGFSEPSAFHRAFKRWTGETPAEFRGQARPPDREETSS